MNAQSKITGVILAGGRALRLGGIDKGLALYRGRPLIEWVIERIGPQVDELLINANRNLERYEAYGLRVVSDRQGGFLGPLAGLDAALHCAAHSWVLTVPCDAPNLPIDLASRLCVPTGDPQCEAVVAASGDQWQPVVALYKKALASELERFLADGGRKVENWIRTRNHIVVRCDPCEQGFTNLNTIEQLQ